MMRKLSVFFFVAAQFAPFLTASAAPAVRDFETIIDEGIPTRALWPRGCALAEVFWSGNGKPSFDDFLRRMRVHRTRLIQQGVNCAPLD